jgi:hypothetical protein
MQEGTKMLQTVQQESRLLLIALLEASPELMDSTSAILMISVSCTSDIT